MSGVTTATVIAGAGLALSAAGTVASMSKSSASAGAQRESGEDTYQAAVVRNQQLEMQAEEIKNQALQRDNQALVQDAQAHIQQGQAHMMLREAEMRDTAGDMTTRAADATRERAVLAEAVTQRSAVEVKRKAANAAGRAKAVMAASGGGVDNNVLADILGEGNYAADVATYEGKARAQDMRTEASFLDYDAALAHYGADVTVYNEGVAEYGVALSRWGANNTRYQATLDRRTADSLKWSGGTILQQGARGAEALRAGADRTETNGMMTAGINGLSMAAKYGASFFDKPASTGPEYSNPSTFIPAADVGMVA